MFRYQETFSLGGGYSPKVFIALVIILAAGLTACAKKNLYVIDLMPAPEVYSDGIVDPFLNLDQNIQTPSYGILYGTDRKPDTNGDRFYLNERGFNLRLGHAKTELGSGEYTWEEARRISLLKNRTERYPVKVTEVNEIGILDRTFSVFTPRELIPDDPKSAAAEFARRVNEKLAISNKKDVYIYVHGFKVVFNNPLLVATELWHFLGYDGVLIAFAWPSTPATLAYASDLETTVLSSHNLRVFTEFLADETNAENIHLIGYSAGTRVVITALAQAAFIHHGEDKAAIQRQRRIGRVILVGSDLDRQLFGAYLVEGLLKVPKSLAIYVSGKDKALGMSRWLFGRERLGQMWTGPLNPRVIEYLNNTPELHVIDVTAVEGSTEGNGHAYFRTSPWVSSDILVALMYDLEPDERGLVRPTDRPIWTFPDDYIQRLRAVLLKRQ
jgi:esterase/lipase superfamily enzyme